MDTIGPRQLKKTTDVFVGVVAVIVAVVVVVVVVFFFFYRRSISCTCYGLGT